MAVRRFGPTRGAGTRVEEQEGSQSIQKGALGWAGYAAIFEKGPPNEMVLVSSKTDFVRKFGGIVAAGSGPDCALNYFSLANGAGGLALVRVTDGNERQASMVLFTRVANKYAQMGTVKAKN